MGIFINKNNFKSNQEKIELRLNYFLLKYNYKNVDLFNVNLFYFYFRFCSLYILFSTFLLIFYIFVNLYSSHIAYREFFFFYLSVFVDNNGIIIHCIYEIGIFFFFVIHFVFNFFFVSCSMVFSYIFNVFCVYRLLSVSI